ncbi:hypothetical protein ACO0LF_30065 [Undibacterium sp. Di27W]
MTFILRHIDSDRPKVVPHAKRTVKLQLQDGGFESTAGRWVIEGDFASYINTVQHRLLMKGIRKRNADHRLLALHWTHHRIAWATAGVKM